MLPVWPDMRRRSEMLELMDDPMSDHDRLIRTLGQFRLINRLFSRSRSLISRYFLRSMERHGRYSMLDVGAGGCDIPIWVVNAARRRRVRIDVTCLDNDPRIIRYAKTQCREYPEIRVVEGSITDSEDLGPFDFVFSNHLLHHIPESALPDVFSAILRKTSRVFVMNDLLRSNWSYLGYTLFAGLFLHNSFAYYDGRLSIRRGFRPGELDGFFPPAARDRKLEVLTLPPGRICVVGRIGP